MATIMNGINSFLEFVNNNWTAIMVMIGLCIALFRKLSSYLKKSDEEKVEIAKVYIKECILKMITDAELDFEEWNKAGSIKRSQVINVIYEKYPVLAKVANQQDIINWIDTEIDNALVTLRDVISENKIVEDSHSENGAEWP